MSRRRRPARPVRKGWTIQRATATGAGAALTAVLLRLLYPSWPDELRLPLLAACIAAALCGVSILLMTAVDRYRRGRRGARLLPLRAFDVAVALVLVLPALMLVPALLAEG